MMELIRSSILMGFIGSLGATTFIFVFNVIRRYVL